MSKTSILTIMIGVGVAIALIVGVFGLFIKQKCPLCKSELNGKPNICPECRSVLRWK